MSNTLQLPTNLQPVDPETLEQAGHGFVLAQIKSYDTTDSIAITTNLSQTRTFKGKTVGFSVFTKGLDRNKTKSDQGQSFWLSPEDWEQSEIYELCSEGCFVYMSPSGHCPEGCDEPIIKVSQFKALGATSSPTVDAQPSAPIQ